MTSTHSTSQLVQLGKTEFIGAIDNNGIRIGYVDTGLNDGCTLGIIDGSMDSLGIADGLLLG